MGLAMWSVLWVGFLPTVAVTGQVALEQLPRELTVQEGDEVNFQCSMTGDNMWNYAMYWYRQGPRGTLEWIFMEGDNYGEGFQDRFKGSVKSFSFSLQILAAQPGDAATYYCGARIRGWSTSPAALVFGKGTQLTVEPSSPKPSVPQVMVMKSRKLKEGGSPGKAACLATNFSTRRISLEMSSAEVVYEQSTPILTAQGFYSAMKVVNVTKDTEVTCKAHLDIGTLTALPENEAEEPVTRTSSRVCNSTDTPAQGPTVQRVNMLSMAVLGLRVLLAKSIAFSTLMSIKLVLF